jgi:ribonuclease P protein component
MKEIAIRENHLYQKVFSRGRRAGGRLVSVCVLKDLAANRLRRANPQKQTVNRIGLSVPKRESGAVGRNRVKRIIREGLRQVSREQQLKTGFLIVIAARPGIEKRKSTEVAAELRYLFRRLDMFRTEPVQPPASADGQDAP